MYIQNDKKFSEMLAKNGLMEMSPMTEEEKNYFRQCAAENKPDPFDYEKIDGVVYKITKIDTSNADLNSFLQIIQINHLRKIKNILTYFFVLSLVGLLIGIIIALSTL